MNDAFDSHDLGSLSLASDPEQRAALRACSRAVTTGLLVAGVVSALRLLALVAHREPFGVDGVLATCALWLSLTMLLRETLQRSIEADGT